jgi:Tol biopolymer transport system component
MRLVVPAGNEFKMSSKVIVLRRFVQFSVMFVVLTSVTATAGAQELVFSRRVYAAQGTTYQQLWSWSAADGTFKQLTNSARSHDAPVCSPDGTRIFFLTGNRYDLTGYVGQSHWQFDRATGIESPTTNAPLTDPPTGWKARVPQCDGDRGTLAPSPDGSRLACTVGGEGVAIVDLTTNKESARIPFGQSYTTVAGPYPPWALQLQWSPEGRTLLVGTYGEFGSSTSSRLDYFLLDVAAKTWTRAMTGDNPVWLPDGHAIIYETPRDLAPLPPDGAHSVWSAHLARFDLSTRKETLLTSGVTNNVQPTLCGR